MNDDNVNIPLVRKVREAMRAYSMKMMNPFSGIRRGRAWMTRPAGMPYTDVNNAYMRSNRTPGMMARKELMKVVNATDIDYNVLTDEDMSAAKEYCKGMMNLVTEHKDSMVRDSWSSCYQSINAFKPTGFLAVITDYDGIIAFIACMRILRLIDENTEKNRSFNICFKSVEESACLLIDGYPEELVIQSALTACNEK